mmetsp:Transcript_18459/g.39928  ORF Transcript_18459/g.39928 Transcript_18459/m.39928 type:complete len:133 (+) Transcript_18459:92-490(+)
MQTILSGHATSPCEDMSFLRHGHRRQETINRTLRPNRVANHATTSPMTRTLDPSGPVRRWKYTVDSSPYREEGFISLLFASSPECLDSWSSPEMEGPPSMDRKKFRDEDDISPFSVRASRTSSLRQILRSDN